MDGKLKTPVIKERGHSRLGSTKAGRLRALSEARKTILGKGKTLIVAYSWKNGKGEPVSRFSRSGDIVEQWLMAEKIKKDLIADGLNSGHVLSWAKEHLSCYSSNVRRKVERAVIAEIKEASHG